MAIERKERDTPVSATNSSVEQTTYNDWSAQRHQLLRWISEKENTQQYLGNQMATDIIVGAKKK